MRVKREKMKNATASLHQEWYTMLVKDCFVAHLFWQQLVKKSLRSEHGLINQLFCFSKHNVYTPGGP